MKGDFEDVDVICVDSPRDVQRLKLIAEELDNDTGREVFLAFYSGLETVSQVAEKLGLTIQLASYHVEKLVLAGLLREKREPIFSVRGRAVKRYEPARAALLIVPSLQHLKANREVAQRVRRSVFDVLGRLLPQIAVPAGVFLATLFSSEIASSARLVAARLGGLAKILGRPTGLANTSQPQPTVFTGSQTGMTYSHSGGTAFWPFIHLSQPASPELFALAVVFGLLAWLAVRLVLRGLRSLPH